MKYQISVTQRAEQEIAEIHHWLHERSVSGAAAWLAALDGAIERLKSNPTGFAIALESDDAPTDIREFSFKTRKGRKYRGVFRVTGDTVLVLHIRGPGQQLLRPEDFDE